MGNYIPVNQSKSKKPIEARLSDGTIARYESIAEASRQLGVKSHTISNSLRNPNGSTKYRFIGGEFNSHKEKNPLIESNKRLYSVYFGMRNRCLNPKNPNYDYYGGRGIKVCEEWLEFENFVEWAHENGYDKNAPRGECTLDRINPDGNYEPDNCRWINQSAQLRNRNKYCTKANVIENACSVCGSDVIESFIFCPYCGAKLLREHTLYSLTP